MSGQKFIHLHTHSYYSFVEGVPSPQALAKIAAQHEMPAMALSDHYGLSGAIEFYDACHAVGVQPIIGLELPVEHPFGMGELVLLAADLAGWGNLCRLSSVLQSSPQRDPTQGITWDILAQRTQGLICLSGGPRGLPGILMQRNQEEDISRYLSALNELFPDRFYIQLYRHRQRDRQVANALNRQAGKLNLPTVASHSIYYLLPEQSNLAKTLNAMRLNRRREQLSPEQEPTHEAHFLSAEQMTRRFAEYPTALAATREIASRCRLELPLGEAHYPEVPLPAGKTAIDVLRQRAKQGAVRKYGSLSGEIVARLDHELSVIGERQYAPLFLIVQEILEFARGNGVPISSRGSAASSLVAYCLDITSPDPMALNLYFERFLNPARSKPPDIDTDLCSARRDKVLYHVYEQYGAERVAMVATINRFRRRSALREVAKAYGISPAEIKKMTEDLPWRGWGPPWRGSSTPGEPYKELAAQFRTPLHQAVFQDAAAILKSPRHLSVHPGGIVIAPGPINDLAPTHLASKGVIITQFDLDSIDRLGLVKIDLLGTRGLSVLGDVAETIFGWRKMEFANSLAVLEAIPIDDPDTAQLVRSAQTIGCFQIESPGMRLTLREIDAHTPEDLMIALALYRPGPLTGGLKEAYVQRHLGRQRVEHIHPALASLLQDTYGVILYQEQVLRIASELAGLSLADADLLRRAMSHFDPGERMRTLKQRFVEGALKKNGVPGHIGEQIWELMAAFAGYGFPKAHAASYAEVAWRSAWCKTHFPVEFMAAVLANWGGYYSQRIYLNEARRLGIPVRSPHINHAGVNFGVVYPQEQGIIYMGLSQVRDLTRKTQKRIINERPFGSLGDFLTRVDPRPVEIVNLVKIGALHGLGNIPDLLRQVGKGGWRYRQPPLFDSSLENVPTGEWDLAQRVAAQQAILGASLDAHPLELLNRQVVQSLNPTHSAQIFNKIGEPVRLLGIRQTLQRVQGQEGEPYYALELEDLQGLVTVFLPQSVYRRHREALRSRAALIIEGEAVIEPKLGETIVLGQKIWLFSG